MSTQRQIEANRRNGEFSKGPVSVEGKAASARNALKHGLCSRKLVLPDEDPEEFAELNKALIEELSPVGALEAILVERITALVWRLRRLGLIEAGVMTMQGIRAFAEAAHEKALRNTGAR